MKLSKILIGMVPCLSLALISQAATDTVLDWQFSSVGNPAAPTAATTVNPSGGTASASFIGGTTKYYFGSGPSGLYGSPSGLWDMQNGVLKLDISDRTSASPLTYTLAVTHAVTDPVTPTFPLVGTLAFSLPSEVFVGRTVVVPNSGSMVASWVTDTYQWTGVNLNWQPVTLTIGPGTGNTDVFFDAVKLTVSGGELVVPEPAYSKLAAAGLLVLGMRAWFQRKSKAAPSVSA